MAANFTQFPIETATITERVASNPATLPLAGTEGVLIDQGNTTKGATTAAIAATLPEATTTAAGKLSAGDKTKIDSIASNATANASDAELRNRATHTGEQAISTVTGLQTALDGKEAAGAAASAQSAAISAAATDATTKANAAQSAAIAASAPAAQGVTNGNSHDHAGGDGAQIAYGSLSGLPTLPTGTNTGDQTLSNTSNATSHTVALSASGGSLQLVEGANVTLTTTGTGSAAVVTIASTASGGGGGDVVGPASSIDGRAALFDGNTGKLLKQSAAGPVFEGDARLTDARTPTAHNQAASTITGLATVATTGLYDDLIGEPTLGSAAATASTDYAPAAQGVTGGNAHDHNGGDGGQIAYSSLSGTPGVATTTTAGLQAATSYAAIAYASTVTLDMAALNDQVRVVNVTGPLTLAMSNPAVGQRLTLRLVIDGTDRTLTVPGWRRYGYNNTTLKAGKAYRFAFEVFGTINANEVDLAISEQL
jgi:hypothetical protein